MFKIKFYYSKRYIAINPPQNSLPHLEHSYPIILDSISFALNYYFKTFTICFTAPCIFHKEINKPSLPRGWLLLEKKWDWKGR